MITRRSLLAQGAASAALLAAPKLALAEISLGSATLTTVSDGSLSLPGSFVTGNLPDSATDIIKSYGLSTETYTPECNVTLYRDGTNTVLFDVGSGPDFMPNAGDLFDSLDAAGVALEDITHVVFTHAHPDHIGGLLDDFDDLMLPDASYHMGRAEWDYWWDPETVNTIGEARASFAVGAKRRLEMLEDQINFFDAGDEILPGIAAIATYGHTPGHMGFEVRQGSQSAMVVGDAIGNHHVAFHHPEWASGSDQDAETGINTRKMLMDRMANEQMTIAGFHLPNGGIGRVEAKDGAYRFVSES
ncbi:MBL fold metallo-hydrolase [Planktotalea sp.]|uniref:MBL fold metallo-hydrolase n=1 Tax=Planktotalea sp. TaxID=2029877 RepID=UPI003D6B2AE3